MDKCEFCRNSLIGLFVVGGVLLFFVFMNSLIDLGKDMPCWEAHQQNVILKDCKKWEKNHAPE